MKVFVTGGTGFVGRNVMRALRDAGHLVTPLTRPGSEKKLPFIEGADVAFGDALDPAPELAAMMKKHDAVVHLVGIIREIPSRGITFEKLHYEATRNVVEAAKTARVPRIVHMSANGAAEDGVSAYQTTKWRAEREVQNSGLDWTVFRPSVIFGDSGGMPEFTSQLAGVIGKAPVTPVFGDGKFRMDPVAVEDVAACFAASLETPGTSERVFHLGGGAPRTFDEIVQEIGKALGKVRTKTVHVPFWLARPVAAALGRFSAFPVTVDQLDMLRQGNTCPEHDWINVFDTTPIPFTYKNMGYLRR